jgi:regulator of sirC expression with transglutaminase-like and TPR domain
MSTSTMTHSMELVGEFQAILPSGLRPTEVADMLCDFLCVAGFKGNMENYFDPANSILHLVNKTRKGIPLTLCIIFADKARRVGFGESAELIGFPRHFLCECQTQLITKRCLLTCFMEE